MENTNISLSQKNAGIIMPIFSLDSSYGIGTLGKNAKDFIDWMKSNGLSIWQILPCNQTEHGTNSPFSVYSSIAGNPLFIDYDYLVRDGLLQESDLPEKQDVKKVDYERVEFENTHILKKAYKNILKMPDSKEYQEFRKFCNENDEWLDGYATFINIAKSHNYAPIWEWDQESRDKNSLAVQVYKLLNKKDIDKQKFIQYLFFKQYREVIDYAHKNGISILGDLPITPSPTSADVWSWADKDIFDLDKKTYKPNNVSGVPGDLMAPDGQVWNNTLYNWKTLKERGFDYWKWRFKAAFKLFDVVRLDHFRGFESYYSIPFGDKTAKRGKWIKCPGSEFFREVKKTFPGSKFIAENLGTIDIEVDNLMDETGFPGMKVYSQGDDPENVNPNDIYYISTHDSETAPDKLRNTLDTSKTIFENAFSSSAKTVIFTASDLLNLKEDGRINTPGTEGNHNWSIRYKTEDLKEQTWLKGVISNWKSRQESHTDVPLKKTIQGVNWRVFYSMSDEEIKLTNIEYPDNSDPRINASEAIFDYTKGLLVLLKLSHEKNKSFNLNGQSMKSTYIRKLAEQGILKLDNDVLSIQDEESFYKQFDALNNLKSKQLEPESVGIVFE